MLALPSVQAEIIGSYVALAARIPERYEAAGMVGENVSGGRPDVAWVFATQGNHGIIGVMGKLAPWDVIVLAVLATACVALAAWRTVYGDF